MIKESVIDYPRLTLSPDVWDLGGEDEYILKPSVKDKIFEVIRKYPEFPLEDVIEDVRIVGSICTNQYLDDSDIDVHIIPKEDSLPEPKTPEEWVKDIFKWYKDNREEIDAFIAEHPIEIYLQLVPEQDFLSDGVYSVKEDEWLVGPKLKPVTFDPYEVFEGILEDVRASVKNVDLLLAELRRKVISYEVVRDAIKKLPVEDKEALKARLESKVESMEQIIRELMADKLEWIEARREASLPPSPEEALYDIELAKRWGKANAIFKFIDRYNYLRLISDLEKMLEDDKLSEEEIDVIGELLGVRR